MSGRKEKCSYAGVVTPISFTVGEFVCIEMGEGDFKDRLG